MRKQLFLVLLALPLLIFGQQKANYDLAARFSPKKLDKMIFSLSVDPHWLKLSNKFWYTYETSEGKQWIIVDPVKNEKKAIFDKDQIAAALTRIIKDPFDAQHLPIDSLKFIKDENWIQFEVKSSIEIDKPGAKKDAKADEAPTKNRFEYYNILPGNESKVTEQEIKQLENNTQTKETYFLQVGAFKTEQEADNVKAKLALLGLEAIIQTATTTDKGVLHRVRVGPYSDPSQLTKTRSDLVDNGFKPDLIKVNTSAQQ